MKDEHHMKESDNVADPDREAEGGSAGLLEQEDHQDRRGRGRGRQYYNFLINMCSDEKGQY